MNTLAFELASVAAKCYSNDMEKLVKQVFFLPQKRQDALKAEAEELGITVSDLLRRIIDEREAAKAKRAGRT